jgi:hypothetical protein
LSVWIVDIILPPRTQGEILPRFADLSGGGESA